MKLLTTLVLGLSTFFAAVDLEAPATVNKAESQVRWEASKVTGTHWGYVPLKNATLDISGGKITGGSFDMDMVNLTVEDLTDAKSKGGLTGHLKSDDFFSVEKFNTSTFKITEAKSSNGTDYTITGNLTIKGITQKVSFPAKVLSTWNLKCEHHMCLCYVCHILGCLCIVGRAYVCDITTRQN